jgi:prephenate dehydratase
MKIGFQGIKGAYSEEAGIKILGQTQDFISFADSEDVFAGLVKNEIEMAILPVENSIAGNVSVNMDLIYRHNYFAHHEIYLPINHCLMANVNLNLNQIENVFSHPIALSQCRNFLKSNNLPSLADYDTAGACAKVNGKNAAIAENIQDEKINITRFLLIRKSTDFPKDANKTSLAFSTAHRPGALLEILHLFQEAELNLTRLESRPIPQDPFQYIFFVDFQQGVHETRAQSLIQKLTACGISFKIIGSYKS